MSNIFYNFATRYLMNTFNLFSCMYLLNALESLLGLFLIVFSEIKQCNDNNCKLLA